MNGLLFYSWIQKKQWRRKRFEAENQQGGKGQSSVVQRTGAEDWELLNIIKKNDEALAQKLIEKGCRTFDDYETDMNKVEAIRLEILECADKYFA